MIDLRQLPDGEALDTDVCIVGGGPAGLAVADALRGSGRHVLVLESGGATAEPADQKLGAGQVHGDPRYAALPLASTRRRQLGGTAHAWDIQVAGSDHGVRLLPLADADMLAPAVWGPSWPFPLEELEPYYRRAHELLGLADVPYVATAWRAAEAAPLELAGIHTDVFLFAPGERLMMQLPRRVAADPDVRIAVHGTVTELATHDDRVTEVVVTSAPGRSHRVRARDVVLAAGGIENARLLLASSRDRGGLGNHSDHVGRWFMDHPLVRAGVLRGAPGLAARLRFYDHRIVDGTEVMGRLVVRRLDLGGPLPGSAFYLLPRPARYDPDVASALVQAARERDTAALLDGLRHHGGAAIAAARGAWYRERRRWPEMSHGGWSTPGSPQLRWPDVEIVQRCEQVPSPSNRVVLSHARDRLGSPRADLHWRWTDDDRRGVVAAQDRLARALERAGLGTTALAREPDGSPRLLGGTHHHMGTTRMAVTSSDGVVNADGRIHDVRNVWVAGSSVFPTSGTPNPTLTVLALALRLGARLRR